MNTNKPEVLFITRNFPPLTGGMERLAWESFQQLEQHYNCTVIGPRGCAEHLRGRARVFECPLSLPLFLIVAAFYGIRESRRCHFILRIGCSGLVAPVVSLAKLFRRGPSLLYVHGLDLIVNNYFYQLIFLPFIRSSSHILANSKNTRRLAISKGIKAENITVINPGVEIATPKSISDVEIENLQQRFQITKGSILLSVGRLIKRKGLAEFIEHSLPKVIERHPNTTLLIIGSEACNALKKDQSILAKISTAIKKADCENNVVVAGSLSDRELGAAYKAATAFVFPVLDFPGDVEGFGMVALEAAAHGLPTVAFDSGGVADAVKPGITGQLIASEDYSAMADELINILDQQSKQFDQKQCIDYANRFSWNTYGEKLNYLCSQLAG